MENIHFKGFTADESLRLRAERAMDRIMDQAPDDTTAQLSIERESDSFRCSLAVECSSCAVSINVQASHKLAPLALDRAELIALRKLSRWRGRYFHDALPARVPVRPAAG